MSNEFPHVLDVGKRTPGAGDEGLRPLERRISALEAENVELRKALAWAIAEVEGRTVYGAEDQFRNCMARARKAVEPINQE